MIKVCNLNNKLLKYKQANNFGISSHEGMTGIRVRINFSGCTLSGYPPKVASPKCPIAGTYRCSSASPTSIPPLWTAMHDGTPINEYDKRRWVSLWNRREMLPWNSGWSIHKLTPVSRISISYLTSMIHSFSDMTDCKQARFASPVVSCEFI